MRKDFLKSTAILFVMFITVMSGSAQSRSGFEELLVKDFCDTFTTAAPKLSKENLTMEVGLLIVPLFSKYKDQIKAEWGLDVNNSDDLEKIGEKVGQISTLGCPAFLNFIKNNMDAFNENTESSKTYTGKIIRVEGAPFTYLLLQNKAGKTDKIYWMEFFEGSNELADNIKGITNTRVTIHYKEIEVYDAVVKEYKNIKVATKLEFTR